MNTDAGRGLFIRKAGRQEGREGNHEINEICERIQNAKGGEATGETQIKHGYGKGQEGNGRAREPAFTLPKAEIILSLKQREPNHLSNWSHHEQ
jgi:hypothetical protein